MGPPHICVFRLDGVVVDYSVTVLVDVAGVSTDQLDYLTLQSNRVENSYREVMELPTVDFTISEVKNVITEALRNDELESGKTMHTHTHALKLFCHVSKVAGDALPEVVHAMQCKPPNVISNRETVDPAMILQHTLHHFRKQSRVLIASSVSYLSALSVKEDRDIFIQSFSSKVGHF